MQKMKQFQNEGVLFYEAGGVGLYIDKQLIVRCKKNEKAAYVELFKHYERYLYKLCYSYVQNEQDALDLSQEIYIKVFRSIQRFDEKMPFHPWLRTIAVNTCLNFKRSNRINAVSLNSRDEDDRSLEDMVASTMDVESEIENNDLGLLIRHKLDTLSPKHRMVIILRYYEGLSYDEIATVLKEPLGTVKTDIYRARNALKDKLKRELEQ